MTRISLFLRDEQIAALKLRQIETGVSLSEQIRHAVNLTLFADAQGRKVELRKMER